MTFTTIRVGHITITGMSHRPSEVALRKHVQGAIAAALREPRGRTQDVPEATVRLPQLQIALRPHATEADIAHAVADVLRHAITDARSS